MNAVMHIEEWRPDGAGSASLEQELDMLADILHAVVHTGAGVSFVVPFSLGEQSLKGSGRVQVQSHCLHAWLLGSGFRTRPASHFDPRSPCAALSKSNAIRSIAACPALPMDRF